LGSLFGGFLGLFADGGAMRGRIKPFASGDIIRGPTMFGLAGEAGEEAIMPLKRGPDGKLGVGAHGRGGDTYQISIQALDSRSVRELFMSEGSALVDALSSRQRINRGMRAI
jgi:phage-related minor tail protein